MDDNNIKVIVPEGLEKPKYSNTFKIGYSETEILLDFGQVIKSDAEKKESEIEIVSKLTIPPNILAPLIIALYKTGGEYENKYNKDIGFKVKK